MLTFSIVTPSLNQGQFIRDSLESVFRQIPVTGEFTVEHWVIDGGSTDETLSILQNWKTARHDPSYTFHFISEPDEGMTDAINKGFRRATGDWLMWLNTDDYLLEGSLAKVAGFARSNPRGEVLYGDCLFVNEQGETLREKRERNFSFATLLFYGCFIQSTSCFYRRSLINKGHYLDVSYKVTMDFEYYLRLAQTGTKFCHLPEILAAFRWHENNLSTRQVAQRRLERFRAQSAALQKAGWGWLAQRWILKGFFRGFQALRVFQRCLGVR